MLKNVLDPLIPARLLSFKAARRFGTLSSINSSSSNSVSRWNDKFTALRHPLPLWGVYSRQKICSRGCFSSAAYVAKENLMKGNYCRNILSGRLITQHARHAWKNIFRVSRDSDPVFSAVSKMAGAVSFLCTRSYLIPGIFAVLAGEVALYERASADSEQFPGTKSLYMHAQDGHMFVTSIFLSVIECFILLLRSAYLSILFTPAMLMAPFADACGPKFRKAWLRVVRLTLETAGPAFIKWGQWAATRPDLFPGDLCTELTKLHTKAPAHSFEYSKRTIEKAFGRKLSEIFESFDEEPVASGSVAQVHRASLRYQYPKQKGKLITVAVKVRHPGVGESIRRDFAIINVVAKISSFLPALKWLRLDESVRQFAVFMMSQVDLSREAAHLSRFIYNFRGWKNVSFPKPLYPFVHPTVLVETFEHGESVAYYLDSFKGSERIKSDLARIGTHALLKMLLVDNFVHADMHPGNILVRIPKTKRSRKSKPHVVLIDVGMTAELSQNDRSVLVDFFKAVALRDGRIAANCALKLSKQQNCPNPQAFIEEVEKSFTFWGTPEGDAVHPADCMQQLLEQVRRHQVNIDGNVCTVLVTILVLEGWQRKLDPGYDIMRTLQTMLFRKDWAQSLTYTIEGLMAP